MRKLASIALTALTAVVLLGVQYIAAQPTKTAETKGDLPKLVHEFIAKHCISCHGPEKKKAELDLAVFQSSDSLVKNRKKWASVLQMVSSGEMPPEGRPRPDMGESEAFLRAINGVFDQADRNLPPDPGRVTMRRLNRVEYANTVRDLVGIDFDPSESLPPDEVGFGFDNIGDVLSVSPALMERYLATAEAIMQRAIIVGEPPKPGVNRRIARFLEPAVRKPDDVKSRAISKKGEKLHTPYVLTQDGEYRARVRGLAKGDGEPVKIVLKNNDKELKTFTPSKKAPEKGGGKYEVLVSLKKGINRVSVEVVDGSDDSERSFNVIAIELEGPLDSMPASHRKITKHREGASKPEKTREILQRFASGAYRRPATKDEVDRLVTFVEKAERLGDSWERALQQALEAVLCSPKFLFRMELDQRAKSDRPQPIDDYQLASRLSYFLWSTMPDEELLGLAAKNELHKQLHNQVKRMLADPRSKALASNFMPQWLQLRPLKAFSPDKERFPAWDEKLRGAMTTETEMFFDALVREDRSIYELIDSKFTFLNERLARHYGISDTNGNRMYQKSIAPKGDYIPKDKFVRVKFADGERGGILTQAAILAVTSNPTRTSPVKRGKWVLEQILGTPPPPPPGNVPELDQQTELKGTLRERMEQHRKNPSCANCHNRMDPPGFAFENYDAIGKYRTMDEGKKVDTAGMMPGGYKLDGMSGLKGYLMTKKELFSRCLTEKLLTYAIGRGVDYYDKRSIDRIVGALERDGNRFSTLVVEIVQSDPFRLRRGKDEQP